MDYVESWKFLDEPTIISALTGETPVLNVCSTAEEGIEMIQRMLRYVEKHGPNHLYTLFTAVDIDTQYTPLHSASSKNGIIDIDPLLLSFSFLISVSS